MKKRALMLVTVLAVVSFVGCASQQSASGITDVAPTQAPQSSGFVFSASKAKDTLLSMGWAEGDCPSNSGVIGACYVRGEDEIVITSSSVSVYWAEPYSTDITVTIAALVSPSAYSKTSELLDTGDSGEGYSTDGWYLGVTYLSDAISITLITP